MPYRIPDVVVEDFRLEELDKREGIPDSEATKVWIQTATLAQNAARAKLFSTYTQEISRDVNEPERITVQLPLYTLMAKEVFLTLVGCNIEIPIVTKQKKKNKKNNDEEETVEYRPLFKFSDSATGPHLNMTEGEFMYAWGKLDDDVASEIHSKVLEMNPHWIFTPARQNQGE